MKNSHTKGLFFLQSFPLELSIQLFPNTSIEDVFHVRVKLMEPLIKRVAWMRLSLFSSNCFKLRNASIVCGKSIKINDNVALL